MRNINLSHLGTHLFVALMLFMAGFSTFALLDLPMAGIMFFVGGLLFVTQAFASSNQQEES